MVTLRRLEAVELFDGEERAEDWGFSLDGLSASDRHFVERLVQDVGPGRLLRIATVIAASRRRGRARIEAEYLVHEAAGILATNPEMLPGQAASVVARRVVAEEDWRGRRPISEKSLANWIQHALKRRRLDMRRAQAKAREAAPTAR
jgi:hypothetical protein